MGLVRTFAVVACLALAQAQGQQVSQYGSTQAEQQLQQQISSEMNQAQVDHNNAVAIKDGTQGWLSGAPLAAEQADVAQSQQLTAEAMQQQQQLNAEEGGHAPGGDTPWHCGPYPCSGRKLLHK